MNDQRRTDTPPPINNELDAALRTLQASGLARMKEQPSVPSGPSDAEINRILQERGFPARHRAQLSDGLHGPAKVKADELLPRVIAGDALLFLIGIRGPGKTQMATYWAAERIRAGKHPGYYRKTADLVTEIKTTWRDGGKTVGTEDDVLKKYRKTAYLVLDEFHERGSSEWEARTLINILDHRYDNMLVTILIANMDVAQVREEINPSILSRAEETGGLVICDWQSYRSR